MLALQPNFMRVHFFETHSIGLRFRILFCMTVLFLKAQFAIVLSPCREWFHLTQITSITNQKSTSFVNLQKKKPTVVMCILSFRFSLPFSGSTLACFEVLFGDKKAPTGLISVVYSWERKGPLYTHCVLSLLLPDIRPLWTVYIEKQGVTFGCKGPMGFQSLSFWGNLNCRFQEILQPQFFS